MPRPLQVFDEASLFAHPRGPIALYTLTIPVIDNQCLMRPDRVCVERINGVIGRAQALFDFELYAYEFPSTHAHLLIGVHDLETKAEVAAFLFGQVGRRLNWLRDRTGRFFARRHRAIQIADGARAVERLQYIMGQATAAQVVGHPARTPFASANPMLLKGETITGIWIDREAMTRSGSTREEDFAIRYPVRLDPLPHLRLEPSAYRAMCQRLADEVATEAKAVRVQTGRRLQSAEVARRIEPRARIVPRRVAYDSDGRAVEVRQSPAPCLHGCKAARAAWRARHAALREAVSAATQSWARFLAGLGDRPLKYPYGTLPPSRFRVHGARAG